MKPLVLIFLIVSLHCYSQNEKFKFYLGYSYMHNMLKYNPQDEFSPNKMEVDKFSHNEGFYIEYNLANNLYFRNGIFNIRHELKAFYSIDEAKLSNFTYGDFGVPLSDGVILRYWSFPFLISYNLTELKKISIKPFLGIVLNVNAMNQTGFHTTLEVSNGKVIGTKTDYYNPYNDYIFQPLYYASGGVQFTYNISKHFGFFSEIAYYNCINRLYYERNYIRIHLLDIKIGIILQ